MPFDAATLGVNELIAHQIPHRRKSDPIVDIEKSEAVPQVPQETLGFFTRRLVRTLNHRGQDVEIDQSRTELVMPPLMREYLTNEVELLEFSQHAAQHLYVSQTGSSSEGLLIACDLIHAGTPAIGVMKLDEEEGVVVEEQQVNGHRTLGVTVLDHLLLTDNTRVFKAGVFWTDGDALVGHVSDEQQGDPVDIADYFLGRFLGCRLARRPHVLTRTFYDTVTSFISDQVADADKKLDYQDALHTEINSNRTKIDPIQFAQDHFDEEHRQPLLDAFTAAEVPEQSFFKDTARLGTRTKKSRLRTSGGITISGSIAEMKERVEPRELDGEQVIVIHDTLREVD